MEMHPEAAADLVQSSDQVEELARRLIDAKAENTKLDFKRTLDLSTPAKKAEFCKDLSAMANVDDDRYRGRGYIVFGAEPGKLVGGLDSWVDGAEDAFGASLTQLAQTYIAPVPRFDFLGFKDDTLGRWCVVVVQPSVEQPHVFIKDLSGNPQKHDWFVRINDTTERAGPADYARVFGSRIRAATRPLELEIKEVRLKLAALESRGFEAGELFRALKGTGPVLHEVAATTGHIHTPAGEVRALLQNPTHTAEDLLLAEGVRVQRLMVEERPEIPQAFKGSDGPTELLPVLEYMENETRPLAEGLLSVLRYDGRGELDGAVLRALAVVAEEPRLAGWQYISQLRLYPLILVLQSLAVGSAACHSGRLLRKILDVPFELEDGSTSASLILALRRARAASDFFRIALGQDYIEPIAKRMQQVVPSWVAAQLPGQSAEDLYYVGEFLLALEYETVATGRHGTGTPFVGAYLYDRRATKAIRRALRTRSKVFEDLFGDQVEERLQNFDTNIGHVVRQSAFSTGGFQAGALAAWRREPTGG